MVLVKNIVDMGQAIEADFIPEDSAEAGHIVAKRGIKDWTLDMFDVTYPKGYEWCQTHAFHAIRYLLSESPANFPERRRIMWY